MRSLVTIKRAALVAALFLLASLGHSSERLEVEIGDSPTLGPADASVTIVEFVDFQ